jgi:IMP dehydrogenase
MDYNDIHLITRKVSTIISRDFVSPASFFGQNKIEVPIIASPMVDVIDAKVGAAMINSGAAAILHRFCTVEEQIINFRALANDKFVGCAVGIADEDWTRFESLHKAGCRIFCIDVANGANSNLRNYIKEIFHFDRETKLIVGNVMSGEGFNYLERFRNVIGVRVGVGGGHGCTTTDATGLYHPALSLIKECYEMRLKPEVAIIADGGIKKPGDMCKALAFGADLVMLGSVLAASKESPAELSLGFKKFSGSASKEIQSKYREPKYIEGRTTSLPLNEEGISDIIDKFRRGLVSSMSYCDANNLKKYRENISWIRK